MDDTFHSADNWERCVLWGQNEADTEEKLGLGFGVILALTVFSTTMNYVESTDLGKSQDAMVSEGHRRHQPQDRSHSD